jgi:cytidylate kinase
VALAAQRAGVGWSDERAVAAIAADLVSRAALGLERAEGPGAVRVLLGKEDVSDAIRTPDISRGASQISRLPAVRAALLELQRQLGRRGGVVAEGRDMGTVVFPGAPVKIFLTASIEIRARRRYDELRGRGETVTLEQTRREVEERDKADCSRAVAPLKQAEDAVLVDTSGRPVDEIVAELGRLVQERAAR